MQKELCELLKRIRVCKFLYMAQLFVAQFISLVDQIFSGFRCSFSLSSRMIESWLVTTKCQSTSLLDSGSVEQFW